MLTKMGWKEGIGVGNSLQGITTNLRVYCCYGYFIMGATADLHGNLGWSKMNMNSGGVF